MRNYINLHVYKFRRMKYDRHGMEPALVEAAVSRQDRKSPVFFAYTYISYLLYKWN